MFTRRPSACPRLTELLREAFELLPDETQREVELLSISVDPDHDRPAVLKEFARKHRADRAAWRFVHVEARELANAAAVTLPFLDEADEGGKHGHLFSSYSVLRSGLLPDRSAANILIRAHMRSRIVAVQLSKNAWRKTLK